MENFLETRFKEDPHKFQLLAQIIEGEEELSALVKKVKLDEEQSEILAVKSDKITTELTTVLGKLSVKLATPDELHTV